MRRSLSWFMVVFLVLRSLLGDAMAVELMPAPSSLAAMAHHGSHTPARAQAQLSDTHCSPDLNASSHESMQCIDHIQGNPCGSCETCHSAWSLLGSDITHHTAVHTAPPRYDSTVLVNAPAHSLTKPPIA